MDCVIRELTDIGARLEFSDVAALPDAFEVFVPSKDRHFQAQAIWHNGDYDRRQVDAGGFHSSDLGIAPCGCPIADRVAKLEHDVAT